MSAKKTFTQQLEMAETIAGYKRAMMWLKRTKATKTLIARTAIAYAERVYMGATSMDNLKTSLGYGLPSFGAKRVLRSSSPERADWNRLSFDLYSTTEE